MNLRTHMLAASLLACALLPGCKSHPLGPYVSPRVAGQVVSAESNQPLPGVKVARGQPAVTALIDAPKGGELLMAKAPVETHADGSFVIPGERVLSIVRGAGWREISLTFDKPGFHTLQTNFSTALATNVNGAPVIDLGRLLLKPQ